MTLRVFLGGATAYAFANREIAERFGDPGPVLPPVVDVERFRPGPSTERLETLRRFSVPEGMLLAGTVGKMAAGRGHEEAIAAAAEVPSLGLVHVGHGERMQRLKDSASRLGSAGRNFWTGYQEDALADLYRCCDIFLFAASGSDQGQRAILEAMASGLPVVALDVPGVRDLMTDEEEGIIVADGKSLAQALARLAGSEETRWRMGEKARRRALAFTGDRFAEKAKPWYEALLTP
jgi:glycosyltransferase involved in cell wall biosynthesis